MPRGAEDRRKEGQPCSNRNRSHGLSGPLISPTRSCVHLSLCWACCPETNLEVENPYTPRTRLLDLSLTLASHLRILQTLDLREKKGGLPFEAEMAHLQINGGVGLKTPRKGGRGLPGVPSLERAVRGSWGYVEISRGRLLPK